MSNNSKVYSEKVIYPDLSYIITGVFFEVHKELGNYAREKQYGDLIEKKLKEIKVPYVREINIANTGNIVDFIIDGKILLELKATRMITKEHYRQIQNYLQQTDIKLGMLVNFRERFVTPVRIIRIDDFS